MAIIGHCRLCEQYGPLSEEHTPPRRAFNDSVVFLRRASYENGNLGFSPREALRRGFARYTICEKCNNHAGRKFADSYVKLAKRVATQLDFVGYGQHIHVMAVEKPAQVVKQILMQFISLTADGFVRANPWLKSCIFDRQPVLPGNVKLYLFATHAETVRSSGLLARYLAESRSHNIFAELVFWPLGSVLSFNELDTPYLSPIHQWADVPIKSKSTRDLVLRVNHGNSHSPLDYRNESQIARDTKSGVDFDGYESDLQRMQAEWLQVSGAKVVTPETGFVFSPNLKLHRDV